MRSDLFALATLAYLIKATGVLLLAIVAANLLRRASAGTRHTLWLTALVLVLGLPIIAGALPEWRVLPGASTLLPAVPIQALGDNRSAPGMHAMRADAGIDTDAGAAVDGGGLSASPEAHESAAATASARIDDLVGPPADIATILIALWAAGALLVLLRLGRSALTLRRILAESDPLTGGDWTTPLWEAADRLDLADAPRLLRSDRVTMPFACGLLHPTIVLPAAALEWSSERRRAVLFHELAHIRRRDLLGHTLSRLACAVYWMHPLVWTAARRLRAESERACDDMVLSSGTPASEYADHLLQILVGVREGDAPAVALPMGRRREFEGRMLAILDPRLRRRGSRLVHATVLATLTIGALSLMAMAPAQPATSLASVTDAPVTGHAERDPDEALRGWGTSPLLDAAAADTVPHSGSAPHPPVIAAIPAPHAIDPRPVPDAHPLPEPQPHPDPLGHLGAAFGSMVERTVDGVVTETLGILFGTGSAEGKNLPLLIRLLATDESPDVRRTAAWALACVGDSGAEAALVNALRQDADADVREMSAWGLCTTAPPARAALIRALVDDSSPEVRARAAWSLGRAGSAGNGVLDALSLALRDGSAEVRHNAGWAIGTIEPADAPAALYAHGLSDDDPEVRLVAAWALGQISDPAAGPALSAAMERETDPEALQAITRALVFLGPLEPEAIETLLRSQDPEVRARAVRIAAGGSAGFWPWPWPWPEPRPEP